MAVVTMKSLLESGVHFGHQTRRWDPRMSKYIFAERNGIHIIDLQKTLSEVKKAYDVVRKTVMGNKNILFVGTKKQARNAIKREAERCGQFYVNNRWLGGMLTNFTTIKKSITRLKKIEKMEVDGTFDSLVKKEKFKLVKEKDKLEKNLGGIKNMDSLPGMIFIIDSKKEAITVTEARKLKIPVVGVVDTNCNPEDVDYPIPGNDDAIRAIDLFCSIIANACLDAENEASTNIFEETGAEDVDIKKVLEDVPADPLKAKKLDNDKIEDDSESGKKEVKVKKEEKKKNKESVGGKNVSISMDLVKKLRETTNAGMMDCKKSLETTNGDFDAALKLLKEKGLADAKKRSDRETKEGGVFIKKSDNKIAMVLLGCETDFVAKNKIFIKAKDEILDKALSSGNEDVASYKSILEDAVGQIKENIELKKVQIISFDDSQYAATYIHGNNKIGVCALFNLADGGVKSKDKFVEFTNNICLHIAASSPFYLTSSEIPAKEFEEQKEIFAKQLEGEKKPKEVIEKIITGKIAKYSSEVCLLDQKYVKDDKLSIKKFIDSASKEFGSEITIVKFVRLMIG